MDHRAAVYKLKRIVQDRFSTREIIKWHKNLMTVSFGCIKMLVFMHTICTIYLSLMSDDDVFVVIRRWQSSQLIAFESRCSVRSEQTLILSHTQWLSFLPGKCPVLWQQLPEFEIYNCHTVINVHPTYNGFSASRGQLSSLLYTTTIDKRLSILSS